MIKLLFLLLCLLPIDAFAAIAWNASSNSGLKEVLSSYTWSHTTGTLTDGIIFITVSSRDTSATDIAVSGVTYNSVALTKAREDISETAPSSGTWIATSVWYLAAPTAGANTVEVTFTGTVNRSVAGAATFSGAAQSNVVDSTATDFIGSGVTTVLDATVTTVANNCFIINAFYSGANGGVTPDGNMTTIHNGINGADTQAASYSGPRTPAGNFTETWTITVNDFMIMTMVAFKPARRQGILTNG